LEKELYILSLHKMIESLGHANLKKNLVRVQIVHFFLTLSNDLTHRILDCVTMTWSILFCSLSLVNAHFCVL